jgi:hypothetical protein
VAAVGWHAQAVRRLAWFVEIREADWADSVVVPAVDETVAAVQIGTYGRRLDAAGLAQEAARLSERLHSVAGPGMETDVLASTMVEVDEAATLCSRRGWDDLARDLYEAVARLVPPGAGGRAPGEA